MTERPKSSHEPSSAKEPIVFVVEDDASMRRALSNLFGSVGLVVELFGSAFATSAAKDTLSETRRFPTTYLDCGGSSKES